VIGREECYTGFVEVLLSGAFLGSGPLPPFWLFVVEIEKADCLRLATVEAKWPVLFNTQEISVGAANIHTRCQGQCDA
jgi:hypothetical protein